MIKRLSLLAFVVYAIIAIVFTAITVSSDDAAPIPEAEAEVNAWFEANVKPLADRKGTLNADLEAAEATPKTIKVIKVFNNCRFIGFQDTIMGDDKGFHFFLKDSYVEGTLNFIFGSGKESFLEFGEFKNSGPGAAADGRVKFAKQLTEAEVKPFISLSYIEGSKWLLPPPKL
ncbi:LOW QUALITY PROTEIN: pectinesterase PPME1 [Jatropha curcas]|uniref:LOW QUALITY PROTEIN: pectinesterase PPME1 n=1 Tax=Jatropha curcas TaxID=180498 RepID=UPI00189485BD|nr:LOW QUALITY PROTEIN: pectinesterase PPME1 [Jatropha curcas]